MEPERRRRRENEGSISLDGYYSGADLRRVCDAHTVNRGRGQSPPGVGGLPVRQKMAVERQEE